MKITCIKKKIKTEDVGKTCLLEIDTNKLAKYDDYEVIEVSAKQNRLYNKLKSYWACCNLTAQHAQGEYSHIDTKEQVDVYCRFKAGLVKSFVVEGKVTFELKSISFPEMSEDDFQDYFYNKAIDIMSTICGISSKDILTNWEEYR